MDRNMSPEKGSKRHFTHICTIYSDFLKRTSSIPFSFYVKYNLTTNRLIPIIRKLQTKCEFPIVLRVSSNIFIKGEFTKTAVVVSNHHAFMEGINPSKKPQNIAIIGG
jgi:hypothetical protein